MRWHREGKRHSRQLAGPVLQVWNEAEAALEEALNATGREWEVSACGQRVVQSGPSAWSDVSNFAKPAPSKLCTFLFCCLQMNPGDGAFYGESRSDQNFFWTRQHAMARDCPCQVAAQEISVGGQFARPSYGTRPTGAAALSPVPTWPPVAGPKIDITVFDALRRKFQCATVQLDFQLPIRFNLEYVADDGSYQRPVIVHRWAPKAKPGRVGCKPWVHLCGKRGLLEGTKCSQGSWAKATSATFECRGCGGLHCAPFMACIVLVSSCPSLKPSQGHPGQRGAHVCHPDGALWRQVAAVAQPAAVHGGAHRRCGAGQGQSNGWLWGLFAQLTCPAAVFIF